VLTRETQGGGERDPNWKPARDRPGWLPESNQFETLEPAPMFLRFQAELKDIVGVAIREPEPLVRSRSKPNGSEGLFDGVGGP
jgi:hypothetical protein